MIPCRGGLARINPGLVFQNQVLLRASVRSIPSQPISRPTISSPRLFGTILRSNGTPIPRASQIGLPSSKRIGAFGVSSNRSALISNRRFASTTPTPTPTPSPTDSLPDASEFAPGLPEFSDFDSITSLPEGVGYLSNLGIDYGWGTTSICQWVLEHLHFDLGLSWGAAIVGVAVVTRLVIAYPAFVAQRTAYKSQQMMKDPVYAELKNKYQKLLLGGQADLSELMQVQMQVRYLDKQKGAGPMWHGLLPILQIPFAYGTYKLTRAMAALPVPGLETSGLLWFSDLTVADPLYILPCVGSVLMYFAMKRTIHLMSGPQAAFAKFVPLIIGPLTIMVTLNFAASIQVFFAATAILQYMQTMSFYSPWVRKLVGLPALAHPDEDTDHADVQRSHFAHQRGSTIYQAPRTLKTTATEHPRPKEGSLADLKKTWNQRHERQEAANLREQIEASEKERKLGYKTDYQERVRKAMQKRRTK